MPVGEAKQTEEAALLEQQVSAEISIPGDINDVVDPAILAMYRRRLAWLYGVPLSSVRLSRSAGSIILLLTITTANTTAARSIASAVAAVESNALSEALGVVSTVTPPAIINATTLLNVSTTVSCPPGYWCTAGKTVPCPVATWNPKYDADDETACRG